MQARELSRVFSNAAVVVAAVVVAGCEALVPPPPPPPVINPGFVVARPFPEIRSLNDVVVIERDEERITTAYAVGTDGTVLAFDGLAWTRESPPITETLESVSGVVDDEGNQTVLAVGAGGVILQRQPDGEWSLLASPVTLQLFGVWVRRDDDAFIVGDNGTVLRWDGVVVTALVEELLIDTGTLIDVVAPIDGENDTCGVTADCVPNPLPAVPAPPSTCFDGRCRLAFGIPEPLKSVMGNGEDDVWTVGPGGAVYHYDGNRFSRDASQTNRPLVDVFTRAGIWAAATDGVLLRRRDEGWLDACQDTERVNCPFTAPSPVFLQGIWARGEGDVFAVGLSENLFLFEDGAWSLTFVEEQSELRAIDGAELPRPADAPEDFVDVREVIAVGAGGRIVRGPLVLPNPGETTLDTRPAVDPDAEE